MVRIFLEERVKHTQILFLGLKDLYYYYYYLQSDPNKVRLK